MRAFGASLIVSPAQVVDRAIALAVAHRDDIVAVAGPDGLTALVALCRQGFERVECARQRTCRGAEELCDVLIVAGRQDPAELSACLTRNAGLLREDGVLVVQLGRSQDDVVVREALARLGLEAASTVIDRASGCLVIHRVRHRQALRAVG